MSKNCNIVAIPDSIEHEIWERKMQECKLDLMRIFLVLTAGVVLCIAKYGLPVRIIGD